VLKETKLVYLVSGQPSTCVGKVKDSDLDVGVVKQGEGSARVEKLESQTQMKVQPCVYGQAEVMKQVFGIGRRLVVEE